MVTPAMGSAMKGPLYSLRENGAQHGGFGFHLRLSSYQDSRVFLAKLAACLCFGVRMFSSNTLR